MPYAGHLPPTMSEKVPSWSTIETNAYNIVMLDEPERLANTLMKVA
jgi:16S rRNA C1402 (ribose-2'-O) methylase RsmI